MATYPNLEGLKFKTHESFYEKCTARDLPWGKKVYALNGDGVLQAVIPLAIVYGNPDGCINYTRLYGKVAGRGLGFYGAVKFFASIEDYKRFLDGADTALEFASYPVNAILRKMGYELDNSCGFDYFRIKAYKVSESSINIYSGSYMDIDYCWYDADGFHIILREDGKRFPFKAMAEEAQKKYNMSRIVDFDDDEVAVYSKEYAVDINISVRATSKEVARAEVEKALSSIGLKIM